MNDDDRKETNESVDHSTKPMNQNQNQMPNAGPYHSAGWATIDKNSGIIHVRWWVPLVIIAGAFFILCMSCSLIWGYRRFSSQQTQGSSILEKTPNPNPNPHFENMKDAKDAYMDLYHQIDGFCKTVKSPT